jgi:NADPH:quinone reductase-like Zn-dependent oxidoreductase
MRAVVVSATGGHDVLDVIELPAGEPGPGEVRIRVHSAGVNPADSALRANGVEGVDPPWIPGMDLAGSVEALGEGVERFALGDEVMATVNYRRPEGGAQAELILVPAASVVAVPDGVGLEQAATLPMTGLTAFLGLESLGLEPGQTVAVSGGVGLLGSYTIAIARERGLRVIADAAPADEELVRAAGADVVVPRGEDFPAAVREVAPAGVDGLIDAAVLNEDAIGAVRDGGTMASFRGWLPDEPIRGIEVTWVRVGSELERTDWLEELRTLAASGHLPLRETLAYPPERAGEAQAAIDAGGLRTRGIIRF